MGELRFKSSLNALDDPALPLSVDPRSEFPTHPGPQDRMRRVQRQVGLSLSLRAKTSNGSAHLERNPSKRVSAAGESSPGMKVNGYGQGFTSISLSGDYVHRPSRTAQLPHFNYNMTDVGRSYNIGTRPYAFSHVPKGSQLQSSTPRQRSFNQSRNQTAVTQTFSLKTASKSSEMTPNRFAFTRRSTKCWTPRLTAAPQPQLVNPGPEKLVENSSYRRQNQTAVKYERHPLKRQNATVLGAIQSDGGQCASAMMRGNSQRLRRINSCHASFDGMELNRRKLVKRPSEMTIYGAVEMLTQECDEALISAATQIQRLCWISVKDKTRVRRLGGIKKLLQLLSNRGEEVQQVAAAALRNVVFENDENKLEIKEEGGFTIILDKLKSSRDLETRRQFTGLLWNLSAHEDLKQQLCIDFLSFLTQSCVVPASGVLDGENPKEEHLADAIVFENATGCLRNLSTINPDCRSSMRNCKDLIDSLVYYIRKTISDKTDDQSTENCICILCNLSFEMFSSERQLKSEDSRKQNAASSQTDSTNIPADEEQESPPAANSEPVGVELLWSPLTIRVYVSLINCSKRHNTQAGAIGALQNITAKKEMRWLSEVAAATVHECGVDCIKKVLHEGEKSVMCAAVYLINNLLCFPELQDIGCQVLPYIVKMLPNSYVSTDLPTDVTACLCDILTKLSQHLPNARDIVQEGALPKIFEVINMNDGDEPASSAKAASRLLHTMWSHKPLRTLYKEVGSYMLHYRMQ